MMTLRARNVDVPSFDAGNLKSIGVGIPPMYVKSR